MKSETVAREMLDMFDEMEVKERIDDQMMEYVGDDEIEEFDGDVYEAYMAYGRGEAENDILTDITKEYLERTNQKQEDMSVDCLIEVHEILCDEWCISLH